MILFTYTSHTNQVFPTDKSTIPMGIFIGYTKNIKLPKLMLYGCFQK